MTSPASILVVDDELPWLKSLSHALTTGGYDVWQAGSGEQALAAVAANVPNLVLLDIRMPGINGLEVFRRIKAHEGCRDIPIILISAVAEAKERAAGIELGASDFITKPFHAGELLARVRMQLEMSGLRAAHDRYAAAMKSTNENLEGEIERRKLTEEALAGSEKLLRSILDSTPFPIALVDTMDDNIKFWSRSATALFGHTAPTATEWYQMAYPDPDYRCEVVARWKPCLEEARLSGQPVNTGEYRIACRDGSTRICELHAAFLADNLVVTFHDITERKAAEDRVAHLTRLYAALSQCNQAIVHSTSVEELLPKICRDAVAFGGMKMAWIGMVEESTGLVRPAASSGSGIGYLEEIVISTDAEDPFGRGPTSTAIRENRPVWCQDYQGDPDTAPWHERGVQYGWASCASLPLRLGGTPIGAFSIYSGQPGAFDEDARKLLEEMAYDISFALDNFAGEDERRKAEKLLEDALEILQAAMDNSQAGIAIADAPSGLLRYVNNAGLLILGKSEDDAVTGIDVNKYVSSWQLLGLDGTPLQPEEVPLARAVLHGEKCSSEFMIRRSENEDRIVWANAAPILDSEGRAKAAIVVFHDITDSKKAEEMLRETNRCLKEATSRSLELAIKAEAAARAKSEFLAVMSHELRTPLNGVIGFAELLSGSPLNDEQKDCVRTINDSGQHLLAIVNDILDFSSIEKGTMTLEPAPVVVSEFVESTCLPIRKSAADKGLEFRCETAPGVPEQITGDARRIRQILINLLGNAVKFTSGGSVVLRLATSSAGSRQFLDFSVGDTGIGISSEMFGHLFHRFTQADSTMSRRFGGTGLGLAVSKHLAQAMGGSITVASAPGEGSTFTFHLPLESAPSTGVPPVEAKTENGAAHGPTAHGLVLVVDDEPNSRVLAGKMLQRLGCRAEFAANGAEAVAAFLPGKFSAILMDMAMPVMDGLEATRKIREAEAAADGRVPIIALTANVMPGDRENCLAAGMDDFLAKPFKRESLAAKLFRVRA